jgi:hypothetical protein
MIEEVRSLFSCFPKGKKKKKKWSNPRGNYVSLPLFFFFFPPSKEEKERKKKVGKEKQKVDQRCSFSLFATLSRCGSDCKNTEKTGVFFFRFWKSQRAAEINALDGKQQISLFLRVSDEPHVSKKFFQKKKRRKQPGLHQQPSSLQVVSIRGSKGFFFFFFLENKKKKPQAHAHLLANVCSFLRCLRIAYSHRLLPNSQFSSLRQHRNGATKSFLPAIWLTEQKKNHGENLRRHRVTRHMPRCFLSHVCYANTLQALVDTGGTCRTHPVSG